MSTKPTKVGIVGCGNICDIYFQAGKTFEAIEIAACADLVPERAKAKAEQHGVPKACSVEELLADKEIEIVVNLTIPKAHAVVALAALEAGKHTHGEKPLTVTREDGKKLLDLANKKNLRLGAAPDTFLGGGCQTARKLIDDGWIGQPIGCTAFMMCPGHESWHPAPEFYYEVGGGPVFDMGPYYITALVNLLGPVKRVGASAKITFDERTITSQPLCGKVIKPEIPTHVAGIMEFANGATGVMIQSFDVQGHRLPNIEIYGTEGSMSVPDPNGFGGPVLVRRQGYDWREAPYSHGYADNHRGIGVADIAQAVRSGRKHRASGELAYHVLDVMHALHDAATAGAFVDLASTCERPAPLPLGLRHGTLDD